MVDKFYQELIDVLTRSRTDGLRNKKSKAASLNVQENKAQLIHNFIMGKH